MMVFETRAGAAAGRQNFQAAIEVADPQAAVAIDGKRGDVAVGEQSGIAAADDRLPRGLPRALPLRNPPQRIFGYRNNVSLHPQNAADRATRADRRSMQAHVPAGMRSERRL